MFDEKKARFPLKSFFNIRRSVPTIFPETWTLNGSLSDDMDILYSVYYNTVWRLLYEVYKVDFERFEHYKSLLSEKVKKDRLADIKYHEKYQGKINDAFSKANSLYLKANGQEGIESYSYYVQLVLNQYLLDKL